MPLHIKVADEEKPGEERRTKHRQRETSTDSSAELDGPLTLEAGQRVAVSVVV
jgi:hypothetical protein